jgi:hypothetical protein
LAHQFNLPLNVHVPSGSPTEKEITRLFFDLQLEPTVIGEIFRQSPSNVVAIAKRARMSISRHL